MALFPRTILPSQVKPVKVPGGLVSVGHTGGVQLRSSVRAGRSWTERWWALAAGTPDVEELIAAVELHFNESITTTLTHLLLPGSGKAPNGVGGGTPLVVGASEAGNTLDTDGWPLGTADVMRIGDVFALAGLNQLFRVVTSDVTSDGAGAATIDINPPILVGSSPANNAALTITGNLLRAFIVDYDMPPTDAAEFVSLTVQFREAP